MWNRQTYLFSRRQTHLCYQVPEQRDTLGGGSKAPGAQHNQNNTALCKTPQKQYFRRGKGCL